MQMRLICCLFFCFLFLACASKRPRHMLWAWQRAEHLYFIKTGHTGIAPLVATITVKGKNLIVRPRTNPLRYPPGSYVLPVIRIEAAGHIESMVEPLAQEILYLSQSSTRLQIDFDALKSQRQFYLTLLNTLRPYKTFLSITALASWCQHDAWLPKKIVDEIVPMLFDMSHDGSLIKRMLEKHTTWQNKQCGQSLGLADYETYDKIPPSQYYYFFSKKAFTARSYFSFLDLVQ